MAQKAAGVSRHCVLLKLKVHGEPRPDYTVSGGVG